MRTLKLRQSKVQFNPNFLLKALFESSGELEKILYYDAKSYDLKNDNQWNLLAISIHLGDVEIGVAEQIRMIMDRTTKDLYHVDFDAIPLESEYATKDLDHALWRFQKAREQTVYLMYGLSKRDWSSEGQHPYKGNVSILDLAQDLYHHDLEHLWQSRKLSTGKLW